MATRQPRTTAWRTRFGLAAELHAAARLQASGLRVLEHRFRTPAGEVDLIAREAGTLVFVEVKARRQHRWGRGAEAVDARKRARLRAAAVAYLRQQGRGVADIRFDVIEIWSQAGRLHCRWLRDAFRG